jgi:hypothetical protein
MRIALVCLAALLAFSGQAHASVGFSCQAQDAALKFLIEGAYGRSIGMGPGNFGGEVEVKLKGVPDDARKLKLEMSHLTQNWFQGRDLKLTVYWLKEGDGPSPEVVLIIETRRGKSEESPYRGTYVLKVSSPQSDGRPREASGRVECVTSE